MKRNPYSVVLLDEVEAHPDLFNILLQVFEDGHLTDGLGNRVNFEDTIIVVTLNIGARFIQKKSVASVQDAADSGVIARSVNDMVLAEVKKTFNPEYIDESMKSSCSRRSRTTTFRTITKLLVKQVNDSLVDRRLRLELEPEVIDWMTNNMATFSMAPVRCAARSSAIDPLSEELIRRGVSRVAICRCISTRESWRTAQAGTTENGRQASLTRLRMGGRAGLRRGLRQGRWSSCASRKPSRSSYLAGAFRPGGGRSVAAPQLCVFLHFARGPWGRRRGACSDAPGDSPPVQAPAAPAAELPATICGQTVTAQPAASGRLQPAPPRGDALLRETGRKIRWSSRRPTSITCS